MATSAPAHVPIDKPRPPRQRSRIAIVGCGSGLHLPAIVLLPILALLSGGCGRNAGSVDAEGKSPRQKLVVAAAANLKFAFDQVEAAFEKEHPEIDLAITYGSSGNFFAQLCQKAGFDVFFSADTRYPKALVERGLATPTGYFQYAVGRIVIWAPTDSPLNLQALQIQAVVAPSVRKIAIANPRLAPYGRAAEEALRALGVYERAKDRLVMGESITQAATFVQSGAADVGVLAMSLALSPAMKERGRYWVIPAESHTPIQQAAVILSGCQAPEAADHLRTFVLGPLGQAILAKFGYAPPASND